MPMWPNTKRNIEKVQEHPLAVDIADERQLRWPLSLQAFSQKSLMAQSCSKRRHRAAVPIAGPRGRRR